ncbi:MAG: hypothetical protein NTX25_01875, partial [Proteobacteria bacterium]|nr:hypothetical protein [Pseudomonadota bacterium]
MNKIKVFILLLLVIGGCSEKKEITMRSSPTGQTEGSPQAANIEKIPSFVLTWNAAEEDLSAYHIYFTSDGTNVDGVEINSLLPSSPDFKTPKFTVSNKE